jgi:hypothetical protein
MTGSADVIASTEQGVEARTPRDPHDPGHGGPVRLEVASGPFGRHLGARLVAERRRSRRPLWVMASRSRGDFTVRDLRDAEAGLLPLDPDAVLRLAELYGIELRAALPPTQRGLEIGPGTMTAGGVTVVFRDGDSRSMIEAYFRLVRTLRSIDATGEVPAPLIARHDDLVEMVAHASRRIDRSPAGVDRESEALQRVLMMAGAEGRVVVSSLLAGVAALEPN